MLTIQPDFAGLLREAMGLDAASIGSSAVERAVKTRLLVREFDDVCAYWELVRSSPAELQALIEAVIVPETWFFRDREAFVALVRVAHEDWLAAHPEGTMRLLSLPCSTGEEPYSIAMALLDSGFPATRCHIDAVDISARALMRAERAVYGKNSFRGAELAFRDRHFAKTPEGHVLSDAVRHLVTFQQGNLFADDFLSRTELYDMLFCRNLLIYFDRKTQDRAVQVLERLLKPSGVLFVGPSESNVPFNHDFVSLKVPLAFAFSRSGFEVASVTAEPTQARVAPPVVEPKTSGVKPTKSASAAEPTLPTLPPATVDSDHEEAFRLADQGRLAEAETCCKRQLQKSGPSAPAFYLMGLIRAAAGELVEAGQYYRKALYLDQNHQDTLVHLALLLDKQGDSAGAQVLRDRLLRLQQKSCLT